MRKALLPCMMLALMVFAGPKAHAQNIDPGVKAGKNLIAIRGQEQKLYFYPGAGGALHHKVLFVTGDGGHRGFAITIANKMADMGNDVYVLDAKRYLSSFTGKTHLTESDVMSDFHRLVIQITGGQITRGAQEKVTLVGWSTGAGLVVLASADTNKDCYDGVIAVSLGKVNILGWRWMDNLTYLTGKMPHEPAYLTDEYLPEISPLPVFVIQSSKDQFIPAEESTALFVKIKRPKHYALIHANNHTFAGNREEFFNALERGLQWLKQPDHH
jgi:dienelactone hydrolase